MKIAHSMRLRCCTLLMVAAATMGMGSAPAHAGVTILGTRVVYPLNVPEMTVRLRNASDRPALIQAWIDGGDPNALPGKEVVPFLLTPPLVRIQPHAGQSLRIAALNADSTVIPPDRESLYYLNVLEIPAKPKASDGENVLQLAVRTRIKLFVRPVGLSGSVEEAAKGLSWKWAAQNLRVVNPSAFHVSISKVEIGGAGSSNPVTIPPKGDVVLPLNGAVDASAEQVNYEWIDDHGAAREAAGGVGS